MWQKLTDDKIFEPDFVFAYEDVPRREFSFENLKSSDLITPKRQLSHGSLMSKFEQKTTNVNKLKEMTDLYNKTLFLHDIKIKNEIKLKNPV